MTLEDIQELSIWPPVPPEKDLELLNLQQDVHEFYKATEGMTIDRICSLFIFTIAARAQQNPDDQGMPEIAFQIDLTKAGHAYRVAKDES